MLVSVTQTAFTTGVVSPRLIARTDIDKYTSGCARVENFIPMQYGPLIRRSGTMYIAAVKDSSKATRLFSFEFSVTQAYVLEFGHNYVRVYRTRDQLMDNGSLKHEGTSSTPYEIVSPYASTDLAQLRFVQSDDTLFLTHPSFPPYELQRLADTNWQFVPFPYTDGPYIDANATKIKVAPSAVTGTGISIVATPNSKTVTAPGTTNNGSGLIRVHAVAHGFSTGDPVNISGVVGTTEANANWIVTKISADLFDLQGSVFVHAWVSGGTASANVFASTDVGRYIRIQNGTTLGWAVITAFTNTYTVTADVRDDFAATAADARWQLGAWSNALGWPWVAVFHQGRFIPGGSNSFPQTIWPSVTGNFTSFSPSSVTDGSVAADNAFSRTIDDNKVNAIRWLESDTAGLLIGTTGGTFSGQASSQGSPISPTDFSVIRQNNFGADDIPRAQRAGAAILHSQRFGKKARELIFNFDTARFIAPDLTLIAEHVTADSPIADLEYQQEPFGIVWAPRQDGLLLSMTYQREQNVTAWAEHTLGGSYAGGVAQVLSIAAIPDDPNDLVWLIVQRTINGSTVQYVEYIQDPFAIDQPQVEAHFVDAGIYYDDVATTTITGLTHLEGQLVSVLADGGKHPDRTVASGQITLQAAASQVHVGLGYDSLLETLPITPRNAPTDPRGKKKSEPYATIEFHQTLNGMYGASEDRLTPFIFGTTDVPMGSPPPLFTGVFPVLVDGTYRHRASMVITQSDPMPMTILAINMEVDIGGVAS